ncbi:MAG: ABC transporter ATP-binding protein [Clostridium sp.]
MKVKIRVSNLEKQYGDNVVLKKISFEVGEGDIFALLGTNGAGKTTTLECIEGVRKYNSGDISINGEIGVQLQSSSLPECIKGIESLKLFAKWNNTTVNINVIKRLGINDILKKQYKEMSTGQKRRLHLALAMTGDPDIIFLDEPTAGLDVEGRVSLHEEIRRLKKEGKTIIIASHDMAEVESLCNRLVILKDGEIAFYGSINELTAQMESTYRIQIKLSSPLELNEGLICSYKGEEEGYHVFDSNKIDDGLLEILTLAKIQNINVYDLKVEHGSLEKCFMNIAKGEK